MRKKNYYEVLGVTHSENKFGIRTAFRRLAKRYHPDLSGPDETRRFQEILEAYTVLSDPESRASYNEDLRRIDEEVAMREKARPFVDSRSILKVSAPRASFSEWRSKRSLGSPVDEMLDFLFPDLAEQGSSIGGFGRRTSLDLEVMLSREEAHRGGVLPLSYPVPTTCRSCGGLGRRGFWACHSCYGQGVVEREETARIKIPAGVGDGSTLEVATDDFRNRGVVLRILIRVSNA